MKTITRSVDDETYRRCLAAAAAVGKTVEDLISDHWVDLVSRPVAAEEVECSRQQLYAVLARIDARRQAESTGEYFRAADRLPRGELYDRNAFH